MTARHVANPVILATSLKSHTAKLCKQGPLPLEKQMSRVHPACRPGHSYLVAFIMMLTVSFSMGDAWCSEKTHSTDGHHESGDDHGGHHSEIGANPGPGQSLEDFESPAELRRDLAIWSFAVFFMLMLLLSAVAWKPIMKGLDAREQGIADMIAATQNALSLIHI